MRCRCRVGRWRKTKDAGREVMDMTCGHTINPSSWHLRSIVSPRMAIKKHNPTNMSLEDKSYQPLDLCRKYIMVARVYRGMIIRTKLIKLVPRFWNTIGGNSNNLTTLGRFD